MSYLIQIDDDKEEPSFYTDFKKDRNMNWLDEYRKRQEMQRLQDALYPNTQTPAESVRRRWDFPAYQEDFPFNDEGKVPVYDQTGTGDFPNDYRFYKPSLGDQRAVVDDEIANRMLTDLFQSKPMSGMGGPVLTAKDNLRTDEEQKFFGEKENIVYGNEPEQENIVYGNEPGEQTWQHISDGPRTDEEREFFDTEPVLKEGPSKEDTEHAFNLGGWLKEMGSSVLGSVDSGLSGLGDWMQKNPALVSSIAMGLGRYAWDPDVGRGPMGGWSNKRALWNSLGTAWNARAGFENLANPRGQLMYKDGGFYNVRPTNIGGRPSYSVNQLYQTPTNKTVATGKVEYQSTGDGMEQGYMFNQPGKPPGFSKWGEPRKIKGAGGTTGPLSGAGKIYSDMTVAKKAGDEDQVAFLKNEMLKKLSSSKDVFGAEQSLRKEYIAGSAEYVKTRDAYSRIMAVGQDPSGFGDLALIFNYMKMLDPNSVVRESEFATASNTGSLSQRFIALFNRMKLGMRLEANQRQELMEATMGLWGTKKSNHDNLLREHIALAKSTQKGLFPNLNPERTYVKYAEPTVQDLKRIAGDYRAMLSGPNIAITREAYERQPYVLAIKKDKGPADKNQGKKMQIKDGTHKGIYVSEFNPTDQLWYWVQHQ